MMTLPMIPQTTPVSTFCAAFHIFILGEHRAFKFGRQVDHSKSQPMDDKPSQKLEWSHFVTHFKFLTPPPKYLWKGLSKRLQILYTGWPCEVFAFELTSLSSGRGYGHVTSLNIGK